MKVFCLEDFKREFEKLVRKSTYKSIEKDIIDHFFDKDIQQLCAGTRLNGSNETPYIKKRVKGSGGWRFYYLAVIKDNCIYLMFFHPKTGSEGSDNIKDDFKASLYKKVLECINNEDYYQIEVEEGKSLRFIHQSQNDVKHDIIEYKKVSSAKEAL